MHHTQQGINTKVEAKQEQHVYRAIAAEQPAPDNSFLSFAVGNE